MIDVRGFTYGLAIGAASMFLLDPERGPARRRYLRGQARRAMHDVENAGQRAKQAISSVEEKISEEVLIERVRSRLGRVTSHASAIDVRLKEGNEIELKGPALAAEHDRIVRAASRVAGVDRIDDDLVVYEDADGVPGLQEEGGGMSGEAKPPGTNLLIGASLALLLVTPLAPLLVRTVLYAAVQGFLHEMGPEVMHRITERVRLEGGQGGPERGERRGREESAERRGSAS